MPTDARALGTTAATYTAIFLVVVLLFGLLRRAAGFHKFFAPNRWKVNQQQPRPLPSGALSWIPAVWRITQAEVIDRAGMDAAMHLRVLSFGAELFLFLTMWCCLVVLPTNLSGHHVDRLLGQSALGPSNFTYWLSPPPPPLAPGAQPGKSTAPPHPHQAPKFYEDAPPAPPGLEWWQYKADVPPLPDPAKYFHNSSYARFGWRFDPNFQATEYVFTNLDKTLMTNVADRDPRLWVHLLSSYVISFVVWRLLYRYNKEAVALRIAYLNSRPPGGESHTVVVRDIPGPVYGTLQNRIQNTALRFLPKVVKRRLLVGAEKTLRAAEAGMGATVGLAAKGLLPDSSVPTTSSRGPSTPVQDTSIRETMTAPRAIDSIGMTVLPGQRTGSEEESPVAVHPGRAGTEMNAWATVERQMEDGATVHEVVRRQFEDMFPGQLASIYVAHDTSQLSAPLGFLQTACRQLQDIVDEYVRLRRLDKPIKRQKVRVIGMAYGAWGVRQYGNKPHKEDALTFYIRHLQALVPYIREQQEACQADSERVLPTAFVSFRSRRAQVIACSAMIHHDQRCWSVRAAPEPRDIMWQTLGYRKWERQMRSVAAWASLLLITSFYLPLSVAVQGLIQVPQLDRVKEAKIIGEVLSYPIVRSLAQTLIPTLALRIVLLLVPSVLLLLCRGQGMYAESQVEFGVVRKYFIFQVIVVFAGSLLGGSLLNQLQQLYLNPSSVVRIVGTSAPETAIFFCSYLLLQATVTKPIAFLRLPGLIWYWILQAAASTERAKARVWQTQHINYGISVVDDTVAVLLGLVYCIIAPIITPIALAYFLVCSLLYKYNAVYVFSPRFQSGGHVWRKAYDQIALAVIAFQSIMVGLMLLKGAFWQVLLAAPLPLASIVAWTTFNGMFRRAQKVLSLRAAVDLDWRDQEEGGSPSASRSLYSEPFLTLHERRIHQLIHEAEQISKAISEGFDEESDSSLREAFSSADRQDPAEDWLVHKQSDPEEPDEAPSLQQPLLGGR